MRIILKLEGCSGRQWLLAQGRKEHSFPKSQWGSRIDGQAELAISAAEKITSSLPVSFSSTLSATRSR